MGKAKGKKNKNVKAADDDDDFDALLNEAKQDIAAAKPAAAEESKKAAEAAKEEKVDDAGGPPTAPLDAAAAFLAAQGLDAGDEEGGGGKKKKKKKKKAAGGGTEKKEDEKVSARGKMVAERLKAQREEEERIQKLEDEESARIVELERQEEEERLRKEDEKQKKLLKKKEKMEKQKKEGTYMTKAQKIKAKQSVDRLAAMKAAGMDVPSVGENDGEKKPSKKNLYAKKGGKGKKQVEKKAEAEEQPEPKEDWDDNSDEEEEENAAKVEKKKETPAPAEEEESDDEDVAWDAESFDSNDLIADLDAKISNVKFNDDDEEDLIAAEKKKEKEKLRLLGIEREKREKEEARKRQEFMAEQEEMKVQEQMIAQKREEGKKRRLQQEKENLAARSRDNLRSPIVVIMGHVDTGKTKLLDNIRRTNVQEGEAGGITQQIGATFFEKKTLEQRTTLVNKTDTAELSIPGMLVIDTPGHESFTNLRSRGSNLCDVAILVVDLMHGLEPQTIESLNMLREKKVPFVVALNKVDRCYSWVTCKDAPIRDALAKQNEGTISEFRSRAMDAKVQLQEQGVNSNIYWEMGDDDWENSDFIPLVPTSAITGEGVPDLLSLLCQMAQRKMWRHLMWCANLQATVLEVKAIDGLGMTVDVLVVNGYVREGDRAVFCTLDGPVVTELRGLLTPPPSREMRVKSEYIHHKEVKGALGVKVIGNNLDKVMAGTPMMIIGPDDEEEDIKAEVMSDLTGLQDKLSTDKKGVMVQASTLGALEALLQFLREETKPPIPVSAIGIGTIHKKDVTRISVMNEKGCSEYATILAFDVPIEREARDHAADMNVRIFTADIIYHLFDQFTRFMEELADKRRQEAAAVAVFPSIIQILPKHVFNMKDPIIVGVEVVEGILKIGTPLCIPVLGALHIGKVTSIESNGTEQETARKGSSVAIKIVNESNPTLTYGRQFDSTNMLYSTLTRASINALKENFKDKLENDDWRLVVKLKKVFGII
jgi:translation initiation factor 5B